MTVRAQHVASVEVQLAGRRVDALDRPGHEDLGAQPAALLERPLASSPPETPDGKPR